MLRVPRFFFKDSSFISYLQMLFLIPSLSYAVVQFPYQKRNIHDIIYHILISYIYRICSHDVLKQGLKKEYLPFWFQMYSEETRPMKVRPIIFIYGLYRCCWNCKIVDNVVEMECRWYLLWMYIYKVKIYPRGVWMILESGIT